MRTDLRLDALNLTVYLTIAGSAVSSVLLIDRILLRWQVILLLAALSFLQSRIPTGEPSGEKIRLANWIVGFQTVIVIYLVTATGLGFSFLVLFFILSANAALHNPANALIAWVGIFAAFTGWHNYQAAGWAGLMRETFLFTAGYLFFGFVTLALSAARQARAINERLLEELQAKNAQLEEYNRQVEMLAAVEERNRLAREVHDTLGHRLTSSAVQLEAAHRLVESNPKKAVELVGNVRQQVRTALQELRQTVSRLRAPLELDMSLPKALQRLAESFQSVSGVQVHLEVAEDLGEITPEQRLAFYRAAQEGLTNVQRHAQAAHIWLRLEPLPGCLRLEVQDDGSGLVSDRANGSTSFGLLGLEERAAALGGEVHLTNGPAGGAILEMRLPHPIPERQTN